MDLDDPYHGGKRSYKASYNRPVMTRGLRDVNTPLNYEFALIKFLEGNGYDVVYQSGVDTH